MANWRFAKENLSKNDTLLPNGSKLRIADYSTHLKYSFMVIGGQILVISKIIMRMPDSNTRGKYAENENGDAYILERTTREYDSKNIISDLVPSAQFAKRKSTSDFKEKYYFAEAYNGEQSLYSFLHSNQPKTLDECYDLAIKIISVVYKLHNGMLSKSGRAYQHNRICWYNLIIDNEGTLYFRDFNEVRTTYPDRPYCSLSSDIVHMLLLFFTPANIRNQRYEYSLFSGFMRAYDIHYYEPPYNIVSEEKPSIRDFQHIYVYSKKEDIAKDGRYYKLRYALVDLNYNVIEQAFYLASSGLKERLLRGARLFWADFTVEEQQIVENYILDDAERRGYIIKRGRENPLLKSLLVENPLSLYQTGPIPSVLDIGETLTLCRFSMESFQPLLIEQTDKLRFEIVYLLNLFSADILALYKKLEAFGNEELFLVQNYLIEHLIFSIKPNDARHRFKSWIGIYPDALKFSIKVSMDSLLLAIDKERRPLILKSEEPVQEPLVSKVPLSFFADSRLVIINDSLEDNLSSGSADSLSDSSESSESSVSDDDNEPFESVENRESPNKIVNYPRLNVREIIKEEHQRLYIESSLVCIIGWFSRTKVQDDWQVSDYVKHAKSYKNRTRQALINLGWMNKEGDLTEEAPFDSQGLVMG